ncbi:MAG: hypothetical protein E7449_00005 [Ruminococcaceae bacterium]|nr:hypothetical protein [Oscillospiraceae bacterium]
MINNGDRPKYYVVNNHPAIIDSLTFSRVQEEIARRNSKKKVKQKGSKLSLIELALTFTPAIHLECLQYFRQFFSDWSNTVGILFYPAIKL